MFRIFDFAISISRFQLLDFGIPKSLVIEIPNSRFEFAISGACKKGKGKGNGKDILVKGYPKTGKGKGKGKGKSSLL